MPTLIEKRSTTDLILKNEVFEKPNRPVNLESQSKEQIALSKDCLKIPVSDNKSDPFSSKTSVKHNDNCLSQKDIKEKGNSFIPIPIPIPIPVPNIPGFPGGTQPGYPSYPSYPTNPGTNPFPSFPGNGNSSGAYEAKRYIDSVKSQVMQKKTDSWGNEYYDTNTGSLTHADAFKLINDYMQNRVISNPYIAPHEKIDLIKNDVMKTKVNSWGQELYDYNSGVFNHDQAKSLLKGVLQQAGNNQNTNYEYSQKYIGTLKGLIMQEKTNSYGQKFYDKNTGIFTHEEGKAFVKEFISQAVINSRYIYPDQKIEIINSQKMKKLVDAWGQPYYDKNTGILTQPEASDLVKSVLNQTVHSGNSYMDSQYAQNYLNTLKSQIMQEKKDAWGKPFYDENTGTITHEDGNRMTYDFIKNFILTSQSIFPNNKIQMIESQKMQKLTDAWGQPYYNKNSGILTHEQARELVKTVF